MSNDTKIDDINSMIESLGRQAKIASKALACASTQQKNKALTVAAKALRDSQAALLAANALDVLGVTQAGKA